MNKYFLLFALLLWTTLSTATVPLQEFNGEDVVRQKKYSLKAPLSSEGLVLIFMSAKCPCSASHEPLLKDLSQQFKDYEFVGIHSNTDENEELTKAHFTASQLPFPILQDNKATLANSLGALKTPHAFVFNKKGELLYSGGVTDSHVGPSAKKFFLREILTALKEKKDLPYHEGRTLGCYIQREDD